jgi:hypothetical protein
MTVKQVAQRLACEVRDLDFSFAFTCTSCAKVGGVNRDTRICPEGCKPLLKLEVSKKEEA